MECVRYLHCLLDEKFIDGAISLFEEDKRVNNTYVLFKTEPENYKFRFIKSSKAKVQSINSFLKAIEEYDVVILHSLPSLPIDIIRHIPSRIKVVWLMWGYDFYNFQVYNINLLYPLSKKTFMISDRVKDYTKKIIYWLSERKIYKESLARIDFFSGVFPYECDLFKSLPRYPGIRARAIDFYYGSTNFFIPESPNYNIDNHFSHVIIGNSADPGNNTLDAIDMLEEKLDVTSIDKIIVPLSYGTNRLFIDRVKKKGRALWGEKFVSLDSYMPLDEYLKVVSNCKVAIYFHERQQASDNVLMQLMNGAKVFMSSTSLMYKYLKEKGYYIYSLQDDIEEINIPLTDEQIINNRTLLSDNYSSSRLIERVKIMNETICNF